MPKKYKVIYTHRTQGEEPESIHIKSIVDALVELGCEVEIVAPVKGEPGRVGPNAGLLSKIKKSAPPFVFELLQIGYNLVTYRKMARAIDATKPDFVYERYALYNFGAILAAKRRGVKVILEVNTAYASAWAKYFKVYFQGFATRIEDYIFSRADAIITVTKELREKLRDGGVACRIEVMHNGVDLKAFNPGVSSPALKKELGLEGASCVVGFVGTLNKWHGIDLLMDAIPAVVNKDPGVRFLVVGEGLMKEEFQGFVKTKGLDKFVRFAGRRPHREIPGLVGVMDIGLMPNSNDYGSPMKIFEYMAMGKVTVAPSIPTIREIIDSPKEGVLFKPGDLSGFTDALLMLSSDEAMRRRIGEAAYKKVSENFTWKSNAMGILRIYDGLR